MLISPNRHTDRSLREAWTYAPQSAAGCTHQPDGCWVVMPSSLSSPWTSTAAACTLAGMRAEPRRCEKASDPKSRLAQPLISARQRAGRWGLDGGQWETKKCTAPRLPALTDPKGSRGRRNKPPLLGGYVGTCRGSDGTAIPKDLASLEPSLVLQTPRSRHTPLCPGAHLSSWT